MKGVGGLYIYISQNRSNGGDCHCPCPNLVEIRVPKNSSMAVSGSPKRW